MPADNAECSKPQDLPISPECSEWSKVRGDLALLGLEALRVYGRIDPLLFVKGEDGHWRLEAKAKPRPQHNPKAFDEALARVNENDIARRFFGLGHEQSTAMCKQLSCDGRQYDITIIRRDDVPETIELYRWFIAKDGPSDAHWRDIFLTLYSTIPDGCPIFPRLDVDDKFTGTSIPKGTFRVVHLLTSGCNCSLGRSARGHEYPSGECGDPRC